MKKIRFHRLLRAVVLMLLTATFACSALAATQPVIVSTDSRVYESPSTRARSFAVPAGMKLELCAVNGGWALVSSGGIYAYMNAAHLAFAENDVPDFSGVAEDPRPATITADTCVYQSPSPFSASIKVPAGMQVTLLATVDDWALIENSGVRAYISAAQVEPAQVIVPATPAPAPDYSDLIPQPARIIADTLVYQAPDVTSVSIAVPAGMELNLLYNSGDWALIEHCGIYAYVESSKVELIIAEQPTATPEPTPDFGDLFDVAQPATIALNCKIYLTPSASGTYAVIPAGMQVNLLGVSDGWAMIENAGIVAYTESVNVAPVFSGTVPTPTPAPSPTPAPVETPDYSDLLPNARPAVVSANTLVFRAPDTAAESTPIVKDTQVRLLATSNGWALIECLGAYGFVNASYVYPLLAEPTPEPTPVPSKDYFDSEDYTNEEKCFIFMTQEMGLNSAAACGILASMRRESNFTPDIGSSYYGLCQWGGGRRTNLYAFCESNGLDPATLEGQLNFLQHELTSIYTSVYKTLTSVTNTPEGAYEAGYIFCRNYEIPSASKRESTSQARGELARDTYFPKYN